MPSGKVSLDNQVGYSYIVLSLFLHEYIQLLQAMTI